MAFAPGGGMPAADPLAVPPPSPTGMNPDGAGSAPFSLRGMAGPSAAVPSNQLPPEMLTGITSAALQINQMLDAFAQATPDQSPILVQVKDLLQQYLAALMSAGAGAVSPTASGPAFPGGGIPRGIAGSGAV